MKILFIHAAREGLSPEYKVHTTLAASAAQLGVEAHYVWQSSAKPLAVPDELVEECDFGRDLSLEPKPSRSLRALMMLRRLPAGVSRLIATAKRFEPDLLYTSQQGYDLELARLVQMIVPAPHLIHLHYSVGAWLGARAGGIIRRAPHLIAVSEFVRQSALLFGVPSERVHTLPNTVTTEHLEGEIDRAGVRHEFGWHETDPLILSVGRLDPSKGHLPLIDAFARVKKTLPNARLVICGKSTQRDDYESVLRERVRELSLEADVVLAGQRTDVPRLMRAADVFSLPTEMEPFGLVFLEAMAAGVPVVASLSGAAPEIVLHDVTGLLSYPGDVQALTDHLVRLLSDPQLSREMGERGRDRLAQTFGRERITHAWLDLVRSALSAPRSTRLPFAKLRHE